MRDEENIVQVIENESNSAQQTSVGSSMMTGSTQAGMNKNDSASIINQKNRLENLSNSCQGSVESSINLTLLSIP